MAKKIKIRLDETFPGHTQKKEHCPGCNKPKKFVRFFDFEINEYLPPQFGRCDRQERCGYFLSPYSENSEYIADTKQERIEVPENPIVYVDKEIVAKTLAQYESNTFVQFLISKVGYNKAMDTVFKFFIGTAKNNGTIFWQIDQFNKPRTAAKIHYLQDGHRNKEIDVKRLFLLKDGYKPCLFGEHQIFNAPSNAIFVIVESEKTAILGECYMNSLNNRPLVWLACSGSNGLTYDKIQPLRGKDVLLVPDFSFHARVTWGLLPMRKKPNEKGILSIDENGEIVEYESAKDRLLSIQCTVNFFDPYPEVNDGSDIADFLIKENLDDEPDPEPGPINVEVPDFSHLRINIHESNLKPRTLAEEISIRSLITGNHNVMIRIVQGKIKCSMNNILLQEKVEGFLNENASMAKFIDLFDIDRGMVSAIE